MLNILNSRNIVITSAISTILLFIIVMFIVNPNIDGHYGLEVISLQVAFDKQVGIHLISTWGDTGISMFNNYIFTDYLYAVSYALFIASMLAIQIHKRKNTNLATYTWIFFLPFFAAICDWIENSLQLIFINNPYEFSQLLFFVHSFIASLKWVTILFALTYLSILYKQNSQINES